ncbi:MAG: hypothetical protein B7Y88_05380 [Sphingomonadales bacterium 32-64-17]|nr:MAG: hypothetical protein B7Y88_05380 [Sphingomonadales bacterium 32-64-17]
MDLVLYALSGLAGLAVIGLISAGLSLGTHVLAPQWSRRGKIMAGSLCATMLVMALPYAGLALDGDLGLSEDGIMAWLALIVLNVLLWAICGLPAAWWTIRRMERAEPNAGSSEESDSLAASDRIEALSHS